MLMKNFLIHLLVFFLSVHAKAQISGTLNISLTALSCSANTLQATASSTNLSLTSFTWSSQPAGAVFSAPNASVTNVAFPAAGTYTLFVVSVGATQPYSGQSLVFVNSPSSLLLTVSSPTTCITSNVPKYSKPLILQAQGGSVYAWFPFPPVTPPVSSSTIVVRPASNTCYTVLSTANNGCTLTAAICVSVIPQHTASVTPSQTILCLGDTVSLQASTGSLYSHGSTASFTYLWSSPLPGFLSGTFSSSVQAFPPSSQTFTVEVFDSLSCVSLPALSAVAVQTCATGLKHLALSDAFLVYPNPTQTSCYLKELGMRFVRLQLLNLHGESLPCSVRKQLNGDWQISWQASDLPAGVYLIEITDQGATAYYQKLRVF